MYKELNKEKAIDYVIKDYSFDEDYAKENAIFYGDNFDEAFEDTFLTDTDIPQLLELARYMSNIETWELSQDGAKSIKHFMVINHENYHGTPYGLVHLHV